MPGVCPGGGGEMLKFRVNRRITAVLLLLLRFAWFYKELLTLSPLKFSLLILFKLNCDALKSNKPTHRALTCISTETRRFLEFASFKLPLIDPTLPSLRIASARGLLLCVSMTSQDSLSRDINNSNVQIAVFFDS